MPGIKGPIPEELSVRAGAVWARQQADVFAIDLQEAIEEEKSLLEASNKILKNLNETKAKISQHAGDTLVLSVISSTIVALDGNHQASLTEQKIATDKKDLAQADLDDALELAEEAEAKVDAAASQKKIDDANAVVESNDLELEAQNLQLEAVAQEILYVQTQTKAAQDKIAREAGYSNSDEYLAALDEEKETLQEDGSNNSIIIAGVVIFIIIALIAMMVFRNSKNIGN